MIPPRLIHSGRLRAAGLAGLLAASVPAATAQDLSPASVEGLRLETQSTHIVLTWPSDPRETFVVLWRSNAHWQTPWITLTNQLRASPNARQTTFRDPGAVRRLAPTETNRLDCYRVFVIPDFWFDMNGVQLDGGPQQCGEDLLPFYNGTKETWGLFKPQITLLVDGGAFSTDETIDRINFGSGAKPRWAYSRGLWFEHDALTNGWHTLQLSALLTLNNSVGEWTWYATMTNKPVRVCLSNEVSFAGSFGYEGGLELVAHTVNPRVNWRLDLCDLRGAVVASKTGQTTNGEIRLTWKDRDMPDPARAALDKDLYLGSQFTTWPLDEQPKAKPSRIRSRPTGGTDSWWDQRLGREFVRKKPSPEEARQPLPHPDDNPLQNQVPPRPLGFLPPPDANRRLPR